MATATTVDEQFVRSSLKGMSHAQQIEYLTKELIVTRRNEKDLYNAAVALLQSYRNLGLVLQRDIENTERAVEQSNEYDEETPESTASQA